MVVSFCFQDAKYKIESVDIKGTPAGSCANGDKLTIDTGDAKTQVCGTADVADTPVASGRLHAKFESNGDQETGTGFKLTVLASYKGT